MRPLPAFCDGASDFTMKPVFGKVAHDTVSGVVGDCYRAAIASLMELPLWVVPHVYEDPTADPDRQLAAFKNWLGLRGITLIQVKYPGDTPLEFVLTSMHVMSPNVFHLLSGTSVNNVGHVVVCLNAEIVHNPTPGATLTGPLSNGYWEVEFLGWTPTSRGTRGYSQSDDGTATA